MLPPDGDFDWVPVHDDCYYVAISRCSKRPEYSQYTEALQHEGQHRFEDKCGEQCRSYCLLLELYSRFQGCALALPDAVLYEEIFD